MMDKTYCYPPNYTLLKNIPDIRNEKALEFFERRMVLERSTQPLPTGQFDADHLKAIHHHLFQDVYAWAGEFRDVEISKGDSNFLPHSRLDFALEDIYKRLARKEMLKDCTTEGFATEAAPIIGDLNYAHPFREGNGRTQMILLTQLAREAGHDFAPAKLDKESWINASIATCQSTPDYAPMAASIRQGLGLEREKDRDASKDIEIDR